MNERIKELAEQAKKYALDAMIKITDKEQALKVYSETYDTKFAELIVRECAEIVRIQNEQFMENESHYGVVSTDVLKHFGLEE